jgi:hypothetical protein
MTRRLSAFSFGRFALFAIATAALSLPVLAALAQAPPLETDDPSPTTRHAQVIAHGVAPMPADEIAWRVSVKRAVPPTRADVEERPAGFILGDKGVVALADQDGTRLARIAPGEAIWTESGAARAVIGVERKAPDYYDIALVPATEVAEGEVVVIGGAPFLAPAGDAFDVDLIRDVLNRAEEGVVSTGPSPALLLVTSGAVFMESTTSGLVEMTAGDAAQVAGDVVITGASRAPAAFVVARIGPELPTPVTAEAFPSIATPGPIATPVTAVKDVFVTAPSAATTPPEDVDSDEDGLTDELETALGTDPSLPDSDADGVSDSDEIDFYGTDALDPDTDEDGLDDAEELLTQGTNPLLDDTDGDDVLDAEEVAAGSDPLDAVSVPATPTPSPTSTPEPALEPAPEPTLEASPTLPATPLPTLDEAEKLEPGMKSLPSGDLDGDGLSTADEVSIHGTNVTVADSDGGGVSDGDEVAAGTDPLDPSDD